MTSTAFVTASGRVVDIFAPTPRDIDFDDIAEHLSKEPRYNGGTPGVFYSVAQHLCLGADWILAEAGGTHDLVDEDFPYAAALAKAGPEARLSAAYFLAHDFHEYVLKDETTPKKRALERVAQEFGVLAGKVSESFGRIVERWDAAIHAAAGLEWPPPPFMRDLVDTLDKRILLAEWAAMHKGHRLLGNYESYEPLPIKVEAWAWWTAMDALEHRMRVLLPSLRRVAP